MKQSKNPQTPFCLNENSIKELDWWVRNLELSNGRAIITSGIRVVIQTDPSKKGWGAFCQSKSIGGEWTLQESALHINVLEFKAVKLALLIFVKILQLDKAHFQRDNMTALSYLVKMGGTRNREMATLAKEIWDFALSRKITITAEIFQEG